MIAVFGEQQRRFAIFVQLQSWPDRVSRSLQRLCIRTGRRRGCEGNRGSGPIDSTICNVKLRVGRDVWY